MKSSTTTNGLDRHPDFTLERDGSGVPVFMHTSGKAVRTDRLGAEIWNGLPGSEADIRRRVQSRLAVSDKTVADMLELLRGAGLLLSPSGAEPERSAPSVESGALPLVSVIVVTYDGRDHIRECFHSILEQSYPRLEVIAVDNASRDDTAGIIDHEFPEVRLIALDRNLHYAGGVNRGLDSVRGEAALVLNQDVILDRDCVRFLQETLARNPDAGAVAPMMKFFHLSGFINGIGNQMRPSGWGSDNFIGSVDVGQFETLKFVPSACFGAVLLNLEALKTVGNLDEGYGSFYEDVDWSFRSWMHNRAIVPETRAVVYHKFGASYGQTRKLSFVAKNRHRLVLKLFQGRVRWGMIKRYLKEDIKNILSLIKRKKIPFVLAYIRAYMSLIVQVPGILVLRRRFFRTKAADRRELDVLELNPPLYPCLDDLGRPRIDSSVLFGYYRWSSPRRIKQE